MTGTAFAGRDANLHLAFSNFKVKCLVPQVGAHCYYGNAKLVRTKSHNVGGSWISISDHREMNATMCRDQFTGRL